MIKTNELWNLEYEDGGGMLSLGTAEQMNDQRSKGLLDPKSSLLFRIQAETYEEAKAVQNIKLGWSPYVPNGKPASCPNGCGGVFYPAGYHECPNCGLISPDQCKRVREAEEGEETPPVHAVIKFAENTDTPSLSIDAYVPEDHTDFSCTIGLTIGPASEQGGEQFYLNACSPKWLARACEKGGIIWGRHHLIVAEYNLKAIMVVITKLVERHSGESWKDVAEKLGRFASWEFEDYRPSGPGQ
jgi:Immunity protein 8